MLAPGPAWEAHRTAISLEAATAGRPGVDVGNPALSGSSPARCPARIIKLVARPMEPYGDRAAATWIGHVGWPEYKRGVAHRTYGQTEE